MKQLMLSILIAMTTLSATAQLAVQQKTHTYEAATWHTWLLDNPQQITIIPPPATAQTQAELKAIKQRLSKLTKKQLADITFWNAGAPAYRWNQVISQIMSLEPEAQLRLPAAWVNIAIYDATILAWKEKLKYKRKRPAVLDPSLQPVIDAPLTYAYPCEHSVTASAAANVLAYFFPTQADSILQMAHTASQSRIDAGVQFASDAEAGWKLGERVAKQIVAKAKADGSSAVWDGKMNTDPQKWTGKYPFGITLTSLVPIVIDSAAQFRPAAPPDFAADMQELKDFKRTSASNYIAYYWANNGDVWTDLAGQKMFEYGMQNDAPAVARVYTVLNTAYHDVAIAIMDAKYAYWGIRPNQYDTTYQSLVTTPPFPGYPSGHAAGAATSSAVLEYFFPADTKQFRQLAQECADSRFYAGIHFRSDNEAALKMGATFGKYIVETWMKK